MKLNARCSLMRPQSDVWFMKTSLEVLRDENSRVLAESATENHITKEKFQINKLKHQMESLMVLVLFEEKNFAQVKKWKHKIIVYSVKSPQKNSDDMCRKFITSQMNLEDGGEGGS